MLQLYLHNYNNNLDHLFYIHIHALLIFCADKEHIASFLGFRISHFCKALIPALRSVVHIHISVLPIRFQCDVVHKISLWWSYHLLWTKYLNQYVCTRNAPPSVLKAIEYSFSKPIPLNYIFFFKRTPRGVTEPCHWIWLSILNTDYISISVKCTLLRNFFQIVDRLSTRVWWHNMLNLQSSIHFYHIV